MIRQPLDSFVSAGSSDERPNAPRFATSDDRYVGSIYEDLSERVSQCRETLRRLCAYNKAFMFSYGSAAHALPKFCMDLVRTYPTISKIVTESIYIVRGINPVQRLAELLDAQRLLKYRKRVNLILFENLLGFESMHARPSCPCPSRVIQAFEGDRTRRHGTSSEDRRHVRRLSLLVQISCTMRAVLTTVFQFDVLRRGVSVESAIAANLLSLSVRGGRRVNMFIRLCINRRHLPTIFDLCVLLMLQPRSV